MRCGLCSFEFNECDTQGSCRGCPGFGSGDMAKCPRCGYEVPRESEWIAQLTDCFGKERRKSWKKLHAKNVDRKDTHLPLNS